MSTPVVTETWAGNLDCDSCGRKRLMGSEFSKNALERYRRGDGSLLSCKACVTQRQATERAIAAARTSATSSANLLPTANDKGSTETRSCASCHIGLECAAYNRNQWNKGVGKSRCRSCVEQALADESIQQSKNQEQAMQEARDRVEHIKKTMGKGNGGLELLKAESIVSALEAEKVTGLKPVKLMGRGGRGGRGRSRTGGARGPGGR